MKCSRLGPSRCPTVAAQHPPDRRRAPAPARRLQPTPAAPHQSHQGKGRSCPAASHRKGQRAAPADDEGEERRWGRTRFNSSSIYRMKNQLNIPVEYEIMKIIKVF
ncbi:hypothetical protein ZWY2020_017766 [Hordeum vulgare]|nr:hypothetical protein ZWY2020_017766 [Hordeum vulgare]